MHIYYHEERIIITWTIYGGTPESKFSFQVLDVLQHCCIPTQVIHLISLSFQPTYICIYMKFSFLKEINKGCHSLAQNLSVHILSLCYSNASESVFFEIFLLSLMNTDSVNALILHFSVIFIFFTHLFTSKITNFFSIEICLVFLITCHTVYVNSFTTVTT
jgi:hypothetical protein